MQTGVYILSGYLGSGKTTLLQKVLGFFHERNRKAIVIMNEIGEEDIDGVQVQAQGYSVKKILNGCICCSIRNQLASGINEMIREFSPDEIIIETTGIADPSDIIADLVNNPTVCEQIELKGVITIVDASRFLALQSRFELSKALEITFRNQIKYADLLLVNKVDLVREPELEKIRNLIEKDNPEAVLYTTIHGEMDLSQLLNMRKAKNVKLQPKVTDDFSLTDKLFNYVETFYYQFNQPVVKSKFESFLLHLPKTVYRAKGFVCFTDYSKLVSFQQTENQIDYSVCEDLDMNMVAVFIGEGMDKRSIVSELEKCKEEKNAFHLN